MPCAAMVPGIIPESLPASLKGGRSESASFFRQLSLETCVLSGSILVLVSVGLLAGSVSAEVLSPGMGTSWTLVPWTSLWYPSTMICSSAARPRSTMTELPISGPNSMNRCSDCESPRLGIHLRVGKIDQTAVRIYRVIYQGDSNERIPFPVVYLLA